jgi:pimeloyl-ACP methyl ester carboxylesterase
MKEKTLSSLNTRKSGLTVEKKVFLFKTSSVALAFVAGISLTASSLTFGQQSKGYAPVNGISLYYEIHGTGGTPLVLIHGGGSTIETTFGNILPLLAMHGKVIAVELQAHGRTSDRDTAVSFEQDADDVAGLLKYLKIEKADFFGFSNGGNTAMQIGIRHPEIVNKLVIVSSFYKREGLIPGLFEGMQHATLDNMPAPLKTAYLQVAPDKSHLQVMHDKDKERMLHFKDWTDENLRSIKAPTLLIIGTHDVVIPEHALEMSKIIPQAELMIVPGTHGSFIGEVCSAKKGSKVPEMTVVVIEEFLKGV